MLREKRLARKALAFLLVILLFWSCFSVAASACSTIQAKQESYEYEGYLEFVEEGKLPEGFLPYEHWASFGNFKEYRHSSYSDRYTLEAAEGFDLYLSRETVKGSNAKVVGVFVEAAPESLLGGGSFPLEQAGDILVYEHLGLSYRYVLRKSATGDACYMSLKYISWAVEGSSFTLSIPEPEEGMLPEAYLAGISRYNSLCTLLSPTATERDVLRALGYLETDPLFETWEIVTLAVGGAVVLAGVVTLIVLPTKKNNRKILEDK